jgi:uncharacterized membrane protein
MSSSSSRFQFVDLFRGCAVFFMIETHVVNALLLPQIKDGIAFKVLTFFNGFVAPSFMFCAGFALAISLHRKWNEFVNTTSVFWRYIARLIFIFCVGYALHLPLFSFRMMVELNDEKILSSFYQADVLQAIALTLIFLSLLVVVVRNKTLYFYSAGIVAIAIIFASPIVREIRYEQIPIWLQPYLTMNVKSQFPLFPWSAFLISGTIVGYFFMKAKEENNELFFIKRATLFSVGGIIISLLIEQLPFDVYSNHNFWKASPEFFFMRLGFVMLFCCGWWYYEQHISKISEKISSQVKKIFSSTESVMSVFGQESLLVYVVHLWVVYGSVMIRWSMIRQYGKTLGYAECFILTILLISAMYFLAFAWHWSKERKIEITRKIQYALVSGIVLLFAIS